MHHLSKSQRGTSHALAALSLLIASACGPEEPTAPVIDALQSPINTQVVRWRQLNDSIPPVEIGLPTHARSWDGGSEALKSWVAETGGRVLIGLKPANEARTAQSGVVPGISRTVFEQALQHILDRGVTVLQTLQTMPIVLAVIDPDAVPVLMRLPFVNYIEPDVPMRAAYAGSSRLPGFMQSPPPQDTSWGLENIRAPQAWEVGFRGSGANIWILDSGVDETHATSPDGDWNLNNAECSWAIGYFDDCFENTGGLGHGLLVHTVAVGPDNAVGYIGVANGVSGNTMIRVCTNARICFVGPEAASLDTALAIGDPRTIVNMSFG